MSEGTCQSAGGGRQCQGLVDVPVLQILRQEGAREAVAGSCCVLDGYVEGSVGPHLPASLGDGALWPRGDDHERVVVPRQLLQRLVYAAPPRDRHRLCLVGEEQVHQAYDVVYAVLPLVGRIEARIERQRDPSVPELSQKIEEPCLQPSQHEISTKMYMRART